MALSSIPQFAAKFLVGSTSGILLQRYCPCVKSVCEPCCTRELAAGEVACADGKIIWAIVFAMTVSSPFLSYIFKPIITKHTSAEEGYVPTRETSHSTTLSSHGRELLNSDEKLESETELASVQFRRHSNS